MTEEEDTKIQDVFYKLWSRIARGLTEEELAATAHMIKTTDELGAILKGESVHRRMLKEK